MNDYAFCHQYGQYIAEPYTSIDDQLQQNDILDMLLNVANPLDKQIIKFIVCNGMTFKQIGNAIGMTKQAISQRLKRYAKFFEKEEALSNG